MSAVDDILFAPIRSNGGLKVEVVDFLVRHHSTRYSPYDWKPISERAKIWCQTYYPTYYECAEKGWLIKFCYDPGPPKDLHGADMEELRHGNYKFAEGI